MKKLLRKLNPRQRRADKNDTSRITTETIEQHRERILAGGRRFKYPIQYARHKLVFNLTIIGVIALLGFTGLVYSLLYWQNTSSDFIYRVTKVLPLPVASIDGESVRYSDYLMKYRSAIHYLEDKEQVSLKTEDGMKQAEYVKEQSMQDAVADTYASKLAREKNITVSDTELELFLKAQRSSADGEVSRATYDAVVLDYYGWDASEYRYAMQQKLLRQKVSYAIDTKADATVKAVQNRIAAGAGGDLKALATSLAGDNTLSPVTHMMPGFVPKTNQDGGLAKAAGALQKGGISDVIKPTAGDGYYIVKLVDSNDAQVNYEYVKIPLTTFDAQLAAAKKDNKLSFYINVPEATAPQGARRESNVQST